MAIESFWLDVTMLPALFAGMSAVEVEDDLMGRWPDEKRSQFQTFGIMFVLFPLLAWLAWWFVKR